MNTFICINYDKAQSEETSPMLDLTILRLGASFLYHLMHLCMNFIRSGAQSIYKNWERNSKLRKEKVLHLCVYIYIFLIIYVLAWTSSMKKVQVQPKQEKTPSTRLRLRCQFWSLTCCISPAYKPALRVVDECKDLPPHILPSNLHVRNASLPGLLSKTSHPVIRGIP